MEEPPSFSYIIKMILYMEKIGKKGFGNGSGVQV